MSRLRKPPLVEVVWLDAVTHRSSMLLTDVPARAQLAERTTSGYLLHENVDGRLIVAHTYDAGTEPEVEDVTVIPTSLVKEIRQRGRRRRRAVPQPKEEQTP